MLKKTLAALALGSALFTAGQALVEEMHQGGLFHRGERGKQLVMHA